MSNESERRQPRAPRVHGAGVNITVWGALPGALLLVGAAEAQAGPSGLARFGLQLQPEASVPYLGFQPIHTVEPLGNSAVVLLDYQARRVEVRDLGDDGVRRFGRRGGGPGEFRNVADVAVDGRRRIYVADPSARQVSVFSAAGAHRATYRVPGPVFHLVKSGSEVYASWASLDFFRSGGPPSVGRIVAGTDAVQPVFNLADGESGLAEMPEEAPEKPFHFAVAGAGGLIFAANPFVYRIVAFDPDGRVTETFGRDIAFEYPDAEEMQEYERRLADLRKRANAPLSATALERIRKQVRKTPKAFFGPHMFAADRLGGLWVTTLLRAPGDSTRIDYFPPGSRDHQSFVLRDRVVALAPTRDRLITLVERLAPGALGRYGLDVYRIEPLPQALSPTPTPEKNDTDDRDAPD